MCLLVCNCSLCGYTQHIMFIMFNCLLCLLCLLCLHIIFFVRAASIDGLVPLLVAWLLCQINIIIILSYLNRPDLAVEVEGHDQRSYATECGDVMGGCRGVTGPITVRLNQRPIHDAHKRPPDKTKANPWTSQLCRLPQIAPPTDRDARRNISLRNI